MPPLSRCGCRRPSSGRRRSERHPCRWRAAADSLPSFEGGSSVRGSGGRTRTKGRTRAYTFLSARCRDRLSVEGRPLEISVRDSDQSLCGVMNVTRRGCRSIPTGTRLLCVTPTRKRHATSLELIVLPYLAVRGGHVDMHRHIFAIARSGRLSRCSTSTAAGRPFPKVHANRSIPESGRRSTRSPRRRMEWSVYLEALEAENGPQRNRRTH